MISSRKNSPLMVFFLIYMFSIIGCEAIEGSISETLIETNGRIFSISFIIALLEIPLIYFVAWKMVLEKLADMLLEDDSEKLICSIISVIILPFIFTLLNMIMIETLNKSLDISKPVKRYLAITNKSVKSHYNSKRHTTSYTYHIDITSWLSHSTFTKKVSSNEYNSYAVYDILETTTKSGFFGFQYYKYLRKVDKNLFPPNTKFPLDESQANKLIEEKRQLDLEEEFKEKRYY